MQARWELWKAASQEMRKIISAFKKDELLSATAAIDTLDRMGYTWNGGVYWRPPIGLIPGYLNVRSRQEKDMPSSIDN